MKKIIQTILVFLLTIISTNFIKSQNCTTLYMVDGDTGIIYAVNTTNASLTQVADYSDGQGNLAVGPDPSNTTSTVFTTSQLANGATVFKNNISTGVTTTVGVQGFAANPTTGVVYGINNSNKTLITASPNYSNLGVITGDATFNNGVVSADSFFDNSGNLYTILVNGSAQYLYKVDLNTLIATRVVQLSGTLPAGGGRGLAFLNDRIYASVANVRTRGCGFLGLQTQQYVEFVLYEINPNTGVSIQKGTSEIRSSDCGGLLGIGGGSTEITALDLASCQAFVPTTAPTCNELFGVVSGNQSIYRINLSNLGTTVVANGFPNNHGNAAYGPSPSNLSQNQFVVSRNNASSSIYRGVATSGLTTLSDTGNTIGSPIGLGTDPSTGIVYGINNKVLTRWTGSGNGTTVGTITGDANWTNGISLNDIAVDNGGNLYVITSVSDASIWLYRVNPSTLTALPVKQLTGAVPNLKTTNGNGLAYLGDFFYFSRTIGNNTDLWTLNAMTGVVTSVGSVVGANGAGNSRAFGDLASCATVTNVPASFSFNCGAPGGGIIGGTLIQNGTVQSNVLRVPISNAINGLADFTVTGSGLSTSPSPYQVFIAQGATFVDIPVNYDGVSQSGNITVAASVGGTPISGACAIPIVIEKDSDGDGVIDSNDLDDDNDGILDSLECPGTASFTNGGLEGSAAIATDPTGWNRVTYDEAYNEATVSGQDTVDIITSTGPASGIGLSGVPAEGNSAIHAVYGPSISGDFAQEGIKQTISGLTVGKYYRVTFKQAVVKSFNYVDNTGKWKVFLDGNFIYSSLPTTSTLTYTDPNISWESRSFIFTATATSHTIAFLASGMTTANKVAMGLDDIKFDTSCDTDNDGKPNYLDTDSDGDGCPDAVEGGDNITQTMLNGSNAIGSNISGTLNSPAIATVDAYGVPVITNTGSTFNVDGQAQGQTAGSAYTSNPAAVAGTASSSQTICWNTAPSAITLTGSIGTIQWQSSADNVTFTNISGATSASYSPGTLTSTTYFRAIVSSVGGCTVTSNTITITVNNCIDAVNDTYGPVTPGTSTTSVIANDKNNSGTAAVIGSGAGQVSITTSTDAAGTAGAWPAGFTLKPDGTISVANGTAAGTYTLYYTICNQTAGSPCDTAAVTITVFIPFCYKPAQTTGTALDTNHGITALGRAGDDNSNWPMVRKGAWTVLEAKTKGFVVNRLTDAQISAIPSADLREGMMVYNINQDCLQINIDGTATGWRCFNTQTCPD